MDCMPEALLIMASPSAVVTSLRQRQGTGVWGRSRSVATEEPIPSKKD
jgi:hypothetical protein